MISHTFSQKKVDHRSTVQDRPCSTEGNRRHASGGGAAHATKGSSPPAAVEYERVAAHVGSINPRVPPVCRVLTVMCSTVLFTIVPLRTFSQMHSPFAIRVQ